MLRVTQPPQTPTEHFRLPLWRSIVLLWSGLACQIMKIITRSASTFAAWEDQVTYFSLTLETAHSQAQHSERPTTKLLLIHPQLASTAPKPKSPKRRSKTYTRACVQAGPQQTFVLAQLNGTISFCTLRVRQTNFHIEHFIPTAPTEFTLNAGRSHVPMYVLFRSNSIYGTLVKCSPTQMSFTTARQPSTLSWLPKLSLPNCRNTRQKVIDNIKLHFPAAGTTLSRR